MQHSTATIVPSAHADQGTSAHLPSRVRHAGCGPACSSVYGHDPRTHEQYGYQQAVAEQAAVCIGVVRTGPIAIDYGRRVVSVHGRDVMASPREFELLAYLGRHLGVTCRPEQVTRAIWGDAEVALSLARAGQGRWHLLRSLTGRVRAKLGPASHLLDTVTGHGYLLRAVLAEE